MKRKQKRPGEARRRQRRVFFSALLAAVSVLFSLLTVPSTSTAAPQATSGALATASQVAPSPVKPKGITCNTVSWDKMGECMSRMLNDPNGAYSRDHVYTDAEKQPVRGPARAAAADPSKGSWRVFEGCKVDGDDVNAIHTIMLANAKILFVAGTSYDAKKAALKVRLAWIWDYRTPEVCPRKIPMPTEDLFCSGHTHLQDGRVLFYGGTDRYGISPTQYYTGIPALYTFNHVTEKFTRIGSMHAARWYPHGPVVSTGNVVINGGLDQNSNPTAVNEIFDPYTGKSTLLPARRFPMYAGMSLLKNGTLFYSGTYTGGRIGAVPGKWDWLRGGFTPVPGLPLPDCRDQGLSLRPSPAQAQKVMVIGGGCSQGVTNSTAIVDLNAAAPKFVAGPPLPYAAMHMCGQVMFDRSIFVSGGADHNTNPRLQAARLPFNGKAWETLPSPSVGRMYHSTCALLPNGSVATFGTTAAQGIVETRIEIFTPVFGPPGAPRPVFTGSSPVLKQGGTHEATWTGPASITTASFIRLDAKTHSADPTQMDIDVPVTPVTWGRVKLKIDPSGGIVPPGVYMLILRDWRNIPSDARFVRVEDPKRPLGAGGVSGVLPSSCGDCLSCC